MVMEEASSSGTTQTSYPCGVLYRFPAVYALAMRLIYGKSYSTRYRSVACYVPPHSTVLDVCCGDAKLSSFLPKSVSYRGIDISPACVSYASKMGISAALGDIENTPIPQADVIVIQGSLYQFKDPKKTYCQTVPVC